MMDNKSAAINFSSILTAMNGRKDLAEEIVNLFLQQAPQDILAINAALERENNEEIIRTAHHMKSTVSIFGTSNLSQILHTMEDLGRSGNNLDKIKLLYLELEEECHKACEEIKLKMNSNY